MPSLSAIPVVRVTQSLFVIGLSTIAICYVLCVYVLGAIAPLPHVPMISDTFVPQPASFVSRFGMTATAFLLWLTQLFFLFYAKVSPGASPARDHFAFWTGSVGAFGLAIVAACNEDEDGTLHGTGAGMFFIGQLIMMVIMTRRAYYLAHHGSLTTTYADAHFKAAITVVATAFGLGFVVFSSNWGKWSNQIAICEWSATFCIFLFNRSLIPEFADNVYIGELYFPEPPVPLPLSSSQDAALPAALAEPLPHIFVPQAPLKADPTPMTVV